MDRFPKDFLWGAATSSHQVEGDNFYNDWWEWEISGGTEPSGKACDHYHLFRDDFAIAKELGHNVHRLSLEWSRLEKSEGEWDNSEWEHYRQVIDELIRLEIEPIVTLNHFTIPVWLANRGGWQSRDMPRLFAKFAQNAVKHLGDKVQYWITINEPLVLAYIGYFQGKWPPFKKSFDDMLLAARNMLVSHVEAYSLMTLTADNIPGLRSPKIGIAVNVATFHPCSKMSIRDNLSAYLRANFQNQSFVSSLVSGNVNFFPYMNFKLSAAKTVDFIGLNYYFREFVHHKRPFIQNPFGSICSHAHHEDAGPRTSMGWEIYPRGLYEVVMSYAKYKLPIMITENGLAADNDAVRREYIKGHLIWLFQAIKEGAPVAGYLHWSLLDNFEWAEGFSKRFGMVHVDFKTQKRTVKDSARYMAEIIKTGVVK
ncbi:MAG TPA: glycoside hydrolase family 1 protein [Candidatus Omnitrophota bacterium]|nr:glycoside hydrolase family 1 protein [Candidatus Omnitrophota bacterium]HPS21153.1 glycoside hydrolase family 1 protein [Candidatus Omnitrophota bacterium]